jgi:hypothetical protein
MGLAQAQATGAARLARRGCSRVGLTRAEHGALCCQCRLDSGCGAPLRRRAYRPSCRTSPDLFLRRSAHTTAEVDGRLSSSLHGRPVEDHATLVLTTPDGREAIVEVGTRSRSRS